MGIAVVGFARLVMWVVLGVHTGDDLDPVPEWLPMVVLGAGVATVVVGLVGAYALCRSRPAAREL